MSDRNGRSKTSRGNLGKHIPEALSPAGSTVVAVRLPNELVEALDAKRGDTSRSEYIRRLVQQDVSPVSEEE